MILASIPVNYGLVFILPFTLLLLGKVRLAVLGAFYIHLFFFELVPWLCLDSIVSAYMCPVCLGVSLHCFLT